LLRRGSTPTRSILAAPPTTSLGTCPDHPSGEPPLLSPLSSKKRINLIVFACFSV
jgi:hypothetical protein